jgi:hypothetical protein
VLHTCWRKLMFAACFSDMLASTCVITCVLTCCGVTVFKEQVVLALQ